MSMKNLVQLTAVGSALLWASSALAATPSSGTLSPESRSITVTGGPFPIPNVTPQLYVEGIADPECAGAVGVLCDVFDFTLDLPEDFYTTNPQDLVKIKMSWDVATGVEDYDFYLYDASGAIVNQGEGTTNPETMTFCAGQGPQAYQIIIYPFSAVAATYTMTVDLVTDERARCKAPKVSSASGKSTQFGGALGFALLLPLLGFATLRSRRA